MQRTFWKTVQNLGVIWGLFSVVVIVAGATALHAVYTGSGPSYLGVSHYSQVESIPVAGQVLGPALPGALGFLAPRLFSLGLFAAAFTTLISVALTMTYFCLDLARARLALHRRQPALQDGLRRAGSPCRRWSRRSGSCRRCSRRLLAMVGNLLMAPMAVAVIIYFVNRPVIGEFRANAGRNALLGVTLRLRAGAGDQRPAGLVLMAARAVARRRRPRHRGGRRRRRGAAARRRRRPATWPRALVAGGVHRDRDHDDGPRRGRADRDTGRRRARTAIVIGAGTVLDAATAERGDRRRRGVRGQPGVRAATSSTPASPHDRAVMPGCFTPTEIHAAWEAGADVVKVFPATVARARRSSRTCAGRCRRCG